jgi:hypothetical protein
MSFSGAFENQACAQVRGNIVALNSYFDQNFHQIALNMAVVLRWVSPAALTGVPPGYCRVSGQ